MNDSLVIGLDLGGTSVKGVALEPSGRPIANHQIAFDLDVPGAFAEAVRSLATEFQTRLGRPAAAIGLSAPGLAARDGRSIAFMPGRFPGLVGLDWASFLEYPEVPVLNDAHAALLGEVWQGAARGSRNVVLLTLGTGVGGAAMVDGRLLRGHSGKAGHLGHISLDPAGPLDITNTPGSLEDAIGNHNVTSRTQGRFQSTHDLIRAADEGDPFARQVWERSVRALAAAIASFTNILDPEVVILGGGIARGGDTLFQPLRRWVREFEWPVGGHTVRLEPAQLGEFAGAYGAAWNAIRPCE